jgi:hypothetical protein
VDEKAPHKAAVSFLDRAAKMETAKADEKGKAAG